MAQSANVGNMGSEPSRQPSLMLAAGEWLLVLPACFFLTAGLMRQLLPGLTQPGSTGWMIFEWARTHVTHLDAAVIFLSLPVAALAVGCAVLWREWLRNQALRRDAAGAFAILRRQFADICLAAAVMAAGGILVIAVHQLVVG